MTMNWFAVHVRRFRENLAATCVGALGLEAYVPMVQVKSLGNVAVKVDSKPLFPGYFFARFSPDVSLGHVECAQGVLRVIKSGTLPIPIDDPVIAEIKDWIEADGQWPLPQDELKLGDRVAIEAGPFAGMMGRIEAELDDRSRVAILLESLWHARVLIEKRWITAAAA